MCIRDRLYAELDKWNATYNPSSGFSYDVVSAGRHRGLTVWPWTYNDAAAFAEAYLNGIYGLTTNFAWWTSDFIVDIDASDATIDVGGELPAPTVTTQNGELVTVDGLEAIVVSGALDSEGEALVIYRLKPVSYTHLVRFLRLRALSALCPHRFPPRSYYAAWAAAHILSEEE